MFKLVFIFSMLFSMSLQAQEITISEDEIISKIRTAMGGEMLEFLDQMGEISKLSKDYIAKKQDECAGEFSSFVINEKGEKVLKKKKLNRKEKKHCLYMLTSYRIKFTRLMFKARKKYLKQMHKSQVADLEKIEMTTLDSLEKLSKKYK